MVKVQLYTTDAQIYFEDKTIELPEGPIIGDYIVFGSLFSEDEREIASYEAGKNGFILAGEVTERTWYLDPKDLEYKLLLTLKLSEN